MARNFPLFNSHLDLAHALWDQLVSPGDLVVDATCGNGHDTLALAEMGARVVACDVQLEAIEATRARVQKYPVEFFHGCHSLLPEIKAKLVVYNLGYLPGGDKQITTRVETTLKSITRFLDVGAISITCYPGHSEGAREESALLEFTQALPAEEWSVSHIRWINRAVAPSLLLIQRKLLP